jgi:hypothetical protein
MQTKTTSHTQVIFMQMKGMERSLINMRKPPPLDVVFKNNNYILLKAMDFRWKLPFIFPVFFRKKATAVRRTDFAGGFFTIKLFSNIILIEKNNYPKILFLRSRSQK